MRISFGVSVLERPQFSQSFQRFCLQDSHKLQGKTTQNQRKRQKKKKRFLSISCLFLLSAIFGALLLETYTPEHVLLLEICTPEHVFSRNFKGYFSSSIFSRHFRYGTQAQYLLLVNVSVTVFYQSKL